MKPRLTELEETPSSGAQATGFVVIDGAGVGAAMAEVAVNASSSEALTPATAKAERRRALVVKDFKDSSSWRRTFVRW